MGVCLCRSVSRQPSNIFLVPVPRVQLKCLLSVPSAVYPVLSHDMAVCGHCLLSVACYLHVSVSVCLSLYVLVSGVSIPQFVQHLASQWILGNATTLPFFRGQNNKQTSTRRREEITAKVINTIPPSSSLFFFFSISDVCSESRSTGTQSPFICSHQLTFHSGLRVNS